MITKFQLLIASLFAITACFGSNEPLLPSSHFRKVTIATNLFEPIQLSITRHGDVFFRERHGAVKVWKRDTAQTTTVGQLNVFTGPEDGLLGLAVDPAFESNHWI